VSPDDPGWPLVIEARGEKNGVVVLRHVDALTPKSVIALSACLDGLAVRRPSLRIVATALPAANWVVDDNRRRLLDQLAVLTLELPPLRDRPEDIPALVEFLRERHAGQTPPRFSRGAMLALSRAPWPGNVRQLENVIRGLLVIGHPHEITPDLLPYGLGAYVTGRSLTKMEQVEMNAILEAINITRGNKVEMASLLGISRSTLYRKMRLYRLDPDRSYF
jgi:DNA-binding NtrC family response regulator